VYEIILSCSIIAIHNEFESMVKINKLFCGMLKENHEFKSRTPQIKSKAKPRQQNKLQ